MQRFASLSLAVLLLSVGLPLNAEVPPLTVTYAHTETEYYRKRDAYFVEILHRALQLSGHPHTITPILLPQLKESRTRLYLRNGRYNIHWLVTNREMEEEFIPIRIPLYKGLIGWRVFFIQAGDGDSFSRGIQLVDLQRMKTAQGHDWADYKVLLANNFNVAPSPSGEGLFGMLEYGRIRYLPRSVTEIVNEYEALDNPKLAIEQNLLLQYPLAYYFFVNPNYSDVAEAVEYGLKIMLHNGDFDTIFNRTFAAKLAQLHLDDRKLFRIPNPYMHPLTPPADSPLWYDPTSSASTPSANTQQTNQGDGMERRRNLRTKNW